MPPSEQHLRAGGVVSATSYCVYAFYCLPLFFCNQKKSRFHPAAVPDGVPNGVFSIYLFRPTVLTARRPLRTEKALLQGKRYIKNPLCRLRRHLPKGANLRLAVANAAPPSPWGRWRDVSQKLNISPDEGRPPQAGVTASVLQTAKLKFIFLQAFSAKPPPNRRFQQKRTRTFVQNALI